MIIVQFYKAYLFFTVYPEVLALKNYTLNYTTTNLMLAKKKKKEMETYPCTWIVT